MTEVTRVSRVPRRRTVLRRVAMVSLVTFALVTAFLAVQMRLGRDPALGARAVAAPPPAKTRVLQRRIVQRTVIVRVIPAAPTEGESGTSAPASSASAPARVVVTTAPAPLPAPAPAPAPVVTKSS